MSDNVIQFPRDTGRYVKIRRFANLFWVKVEREEIGQTLIGTVTNNIGRPELPHGATIIFLSDEVLDEVTKP